jgi:hypothetical protein
LLENFFLSAMTFLLRLSPCMITRSIVPAGYDNPPYSPVLEDAGARTAGS